MDRSFFTCNKATQLSFRKPERRSIGNELSIVQPTCKSLINNRINAFFVRTKGVQVATSCQRDAAIQCDLLPAVSHASISEPIEISADEKSDPSDNDYEPDDEPSTESDEEMEDSDIIK